MRRGDRDRLRAWLPGVALVAITWVAYLPALDAGFVWDDDAYVTRNPTLLDTAGLARMWLEPRSLPQYYPLVHTTYWAEYRLWGGTPRGYHAVNVGLHALAALLAWRVLARLRVPGAWLGAALFALHPVQVESVAWITERKNVLSGVLYLAAALAYFRFAPPEAGPGERRSWRDCALAGLLFLGALLSKSVTATLPAAVLLALWWRRGRLVWHDVWPLVPFFIVGVGLGLHTAWLERSHVGASGSEWALTFVERSIVAGRAVGFYLASLAWPFGLTFVYPRWAIAGAGLAGLAWPIAAAAGVVALYLGRARLGRGPLVALLFFGGTLFPALGFLDVYPHRYSFVADHFQYLACLGPLAVAGAALHLGAERGGAALGLPAHRVLPFGAAILLGGLATLTWQQTKIYESEETLWVDTLRKNPNAWMAHNNLGRILAARGEVDAAIASYRRALAVRPSHANALNNLGLALARRGDRAGAIDAYRRALAVEPHGHEAHLNLAHALIAERQPDAAIPHLEAGARIAPDDPKVRYDVGLSLALVGRYDSALEHLRASLRLGPDTPPTLVAIGWVLSVHPNASVRDPIEARRLADRAVRGPGGRDPSTLGMASTVYLRTGDRDRALALAERALAIARREGAHALARRLAERVDRLRAGQTDPPGETVPIP